MSLFVPNLIHRSRVALEIILEGNSCSESFGKASRVTNEGFISYQGCNKQGGEGDVFSSLFWKLKKYPSFRKKFLNFLHL